MHLKFRNINDGFMKLIQFVHEGDIETVRTSSRYGDCLTIQEPVLITYSHPRERVLLHRTRDANPFFHFYEAMWMLAGRNDVAPLAYYVKRMKEFSDDGKTFNGAYGYRWRTHYYGEPRRSNVDENDWRNRESVDQIKLIINHLKALPNSRRAVLSMWNVKDDLLKVGGVGCETHGVQQFCPKCQPSKDVCCNLNVMFSLRNTTEEYEDYSKFPEGITADRSVSVLDMTVTNRSNDMIWGMLGTNYVHFTFLQEYIASHLGVEVGVYNHFTNNLHMYTNNWKPEEWLSGEFEAHKSPVYTNPYSLGEMEAFDKELSNFTIINSDDWCAREERKEIQYESTFLKEVGQPLLTVFHMHKNKYPFRQCIKACNDIKDEAWRAAALLWIDTRVQKGAVVNA